MNVPNRIGSAANNKSETNAQSESVGGVSDPFFSSDFASDFFGDGDSEKMNKNKEERQGRRKKKKKHKPTKSRSKSPPSKSSKVHQNKQKAKPQTPPPQPDELQDPNIVYGDQLAQLISMGFNDENKNKNAIVRAKGNVQVAVNILITQ